MRISCFHKYATFNEKFIPNFAKNWIRIKERNLSSLVLIIKINLLKWCNILQETCKEKLENKNEALRCLCLGPSFFIILKMLMLISVFLGVTLLLDRFEFAPKQYAVIDAMEQALYRHI